MNANTPSTHLGDSFHFFWLFRGESNEKKRKSAHDARTARSETTLLSYESLFPLKPHRDRLSTRHSTCRLSKSLLLSTRMSPSLAELVCLCPTPFIAKPPLPLSSLCLISVVHPGLPFSTPLASPSLPVQRCSTHGSSLMRRKQRSGSESLMSLTLATSLLSCSICAS